MSTCCGFFLGVRIPINNFSMSMDSLQMQNVYQVFKAMKQLLAIDH